MARKKRTSSKSTRRPKRTSAGRSAGSSPRKSLWPRWVYEQDHRSWRWSAWGIFALLSLGLLLGSQTIGIPSDEPIDYAYGQKAHAFLNSMGRDSSFAELEVYQYDFPNQKYYGAGFEGTSVALIKFFGIQNPYKFRHLMAATCTVLAVLCSMLALVAIGGWRLGFFGLLLFGASAVFLGNGMFNTKDIPFALGYAIFWYGLCRLHTEKLPLDLPGLLLLFAGSAIAMSVRIGALLLPAYAGLFFLLSWGTSPEKRKAFFANPPGRIILNLGFVALACIGGLLAGLAFYPNFWLHPYDHVPEALQVANNFPAKITMLYKGELVMSTAIPPDYILHMAWISFPLLVLIGAGLVLLFSLPAIRSYGAHHLLFLLFAGIFPFAYVMWSRAPVYNGWRHVLFAYPFLLGLAAMGWERLLLFRNVPIQVVAALLFVFFWGKTVAWMVNNHPFEYAYYNEIAGGVKRARLYYDIDYQELGASEGVAWILDRKLDQSDKDKAVIGSNNGNALVKYYSSVDTQLRIKMVPIKAMATQDWDYGVFSSRFIDKDLRRLIFPPKGTIHTVKVEGRPVSYVVERENKLDLEGVELVKARQFAEGVAKLEDALRYNPNNVVVWYWLAAAYYYQNQPDRAIQYANKYQQYYPNDYQTKNVLGAAYWKKKDYKNAEINFQASLQLKADQKSVLLNLVRLYREAGYPEEADKLAQRVKEME